MSNEAILVEDQIKFELNNKKYADITVNLRYMLKTVFGPINDDAIVYCTKTEEAVKPDLIITINGDTKYVSVKTGRAENVHNEILSNFITFLEGEGISKETLETIMLFHYGDGTVDGTGEERYDYQATMSMLKERIKKANEELNWRKDLVLNVLYHCVFQGADSSYPVVDAIYFGTKEYGITTTRRQILSHIRKRSFSYYDNLHIGPLLLRPHSRYTKRKVADERNRNRIVAYWPNLNADMDYISKRYDI